MLDQQPIDLGAAPPVLLREDAYLRAVSTYLAQREAQMLAALAALHRQTRDLAAATERLVTTLRGGGKILIAGNGGSAAEAQHFAAELVGRFKRERGGYPALALTADTTLLTAVANDYGFEHLFARQVQALGQPGDLFIALSTSGESENLIRAAASAREAGLSVLAVTGTRQNRLADLATVPLRMPVTETALVQELHLLVIHLLCDLVETELVAHDEVER